MKLIPLTQGFFATVDDSDYEDLCRHNWQVAKGKSGAYYAQTYTTTGPITMHRYLMQPAEGQQVDHIDGDGLNYQRNNLRLCTAHQNCMNKKKWRGKSRFKGVMYKDNCPKNPWRAYITYNYRQMDLGYYKTEESAAIAYDQKAQELFGKFARLNNVYEGQPLRYLNFLRNIIDNGVDIQPRGLNCREISDHQLVINPDYPFMTFRARDYNVNYFKKEFLWKLTADKYNTSIQAHASMWKSVINPDQTYNSQYGQYFFGPGHNIWDVVTELIRDPDSRQAYLPMLNVSHLAPEVVDKVCTIGLGFRIRSNKLNLSCYMRSSDVIWGLATDIPTFLCLYRLVKALLPSHIENGIINITAMSSHVYARHYEMVGKILTHPEYDPVQMPYCTGTEAMKIIASRGNIEILKTAGPLGAWLCED